MTTTRVHTLTHKVPHTYINTQNPLRNFTNVVTRICIRPLYVCTRKPTHTQRRTSVPTHTHTHIYAHTHTHTLNSIRSTSYAAFEKANLMFKSDTYDINELGEIIRTQFPIYIHTSTHPLISEWRKITAAINNISFTDIYTYTDICEILVQKRYTDLKFWEIFIEKNRKLLDFDENTSIIPVHTFLKLQNIISKINYEDTSLSKYLYTYVKNNKYDLKSYEIDIILNTLLNKDMSMNTQTALCIVDAVCEDISQFSVKQNR